ncbi:hypothetical protein GCM10010274_09150 [Streptomyces lavendofoliae]|uniref:Uncharacterized protein n=1 Tax=Streptomyces lavendofoliae TaxID=67314 RepID=A0A918HTK2_9ACTN|nr:hypothetical protein GCM10010274_09150 [Streptomyces lavendofoliae]
MQVAVVKREVAPIGVASIRLCRRPAARLRHPPHHRRPAHFAACRIRCKPGSSRSEPKLTDRVRRVDVEAVPGDIEWRDRRRENASHAATIRGSAATDRV